MLRNKVLRLERERQIKIKEQVSKDDFVRLIWTVSFEILVN